MCTRVYAWHFMSASSKEKKPIKRIQSIVQLYIRQQSVHMTRKSGQTVGNDQRGWPWKWAIFSFYIVKEGEAKRNREREKSKIPFFEMHYSAGPLLNMFPILYVQVLFFLIFFFFRSLSLSLFIDGNWTLLRHN
jgi:hypothetical protein